MVCGIQVASKFFPLRSFEVTQMSIPVVGQTTDVSSEANAWSTVRFRRAMMLLILVSLLARRPHHRQSALLPVVRFLAFLLLLIAVSAGSSNHTETTLP